MHKSNFFCVFIHFYCFCAMDYLSIYAILRQRNFSNKSKLLLAFTQLLLYSYNKKGGRDNE